MMKLQQDDSIECCLRYHLNEMRHSHCVMFNISFLTIFWWSV